eukprot:TRINITY_DN55422_c0_g1_i2.p3 TRINITY_DN55422_c0_g1~~TRINITY_DN55422_c0_g1_i2.p3  ORF type:complete len:102 (+),score=4.94 TRINITY_DN55422_c0_g1_i2:89-394(+)
MRDKLVKTTYYITHSIYKMKFKMREYQNILNTRNVDNERGIQENNVAHFFLIFQKYSWRINIFFTLEKANFFHFFERVEGIFQGWQNLLRESCSIFFLFQI